MNSCICSIHSHSWHFYLGLFLSFSSHSSFSTDTSLLLSTHSLDLHFIFRSFQLIILLSNVHWLYCLSISIHFDSIDWKSCNSFIDSSMIRASSFIHIFMHSFIDPLNMVTSSFIYSPVCSFIRSFIHSLNNLWKWLYLSFIHLFVHSFINP